MPSESNLHECARAGGIKMRGFPLRKIKRNGKYLLFGAVLVVVGVAAYLEYVAMNTLNNVATEDILQKAQTTPYEKSAIQDHVSSEDIIWSSKFIPQPWRPTYKGKANLHVFEDWCGSSVASLRKNLHFPLYPHSRITVKKLAVAPNWKNYGLRIFGYIHPYISGEFLFAVACSGNCEFWLSRNENPEELQLYTYVGKTGAEWSAPGEYGKYASQISTPVLLQLEKRFYFELIYKQNDRVNDHVEVAWRLNKAKTQFKLIDSNSLSLYTDESSMKMSEVRHIPHMTAPKEQTQTQQHRVEMLREDPRDTFFKIPLLDRSRLWGVLPECSYKPRKMVKGRTISRYQGLQFVRLTYVYPNDYTRLTHMESDNTCFYQLKPDYLKLFGFSHYMKLQQLEDVMVKDDDYRVIGREEAKHEMQDEKDFEYREDDIQHQERKLTSTHTGEDFGKRGGVDDAEGWPMYGDLDLEGGAASDAMYDREIIWDQNFHVNHTDFQLLRTDWIDLNCNVSGNLMIGQSEVMPVVQAFMNKLELKFPRTFSLQRVVNVEKRVYEGGGSRYLLELELMEESRRRVRLVHYVNTLKTRKRVKAELCNTHTFLWNPEAIIHIIVPVRNQARWVQKFIVDMENLYQLTGDKNINIIITDYSSTDMDIKEALKNAHLPRFQYLRLTGSFERSAGLQAGIDLIRDTHSIVFLCDLHIHFPPSFFDSLRKHCVEGHVVFAPLVMRLKCGATPEEPYGYWEVNGFGLLGIYKSDLDAVGGMNTQEFTNRWGGEDWELLDRIVEAGLEVDRLHLRHFFHYHHSKRGMWNHRTRHST